jgi:hypothetical protein
MTNNGIKLQLITGFATYSMFFRRHKTESIIK